jgi:hypothetical protein
MITRFAASSDVTIAGMALAKLMRVLLVGGVSITLHLDSRAFAAGEDSQIASTQLTRNSEFGGTSTARIWTDSTGTFTVNAEFVDYSANQGLVTLRRVDSRRVIQVELSLLGEIDRRYVESLASKNAEPGPISDGVARGRTVAHQASRSFPPPYLKYTGHLGAHHQAGERGTGFYYASGKWWLVNLTFREEQALHWCYSSEEVLGTYWAFAKNPSYCNYYDVWLWNPANNRWQFVHYAFRSTPANQSGTK